MDSTFWAPVAIASFVGSLHCAGMCGPIAALAAGSRRHQPNNSTQSEGCSGAGCTSTPAALGARRPTGTMTFYQAGRLITYTVIGTIAGALGAAMDWGGDWLGWQQGAAWFAGLLMVAIGVLTLAKVWFGRLWHFPLPKRVIDGIVSIRKASATWSPRMRAGVLGLVTGLLPCGWLYMFVLIAAASGSPVSGAAVMILLWAGALPVLISVGLSAQWIAGRWGRHATWATAVLVIVIGVTTIRNRANAAWEPWLKQLGSQTPVLNAAGIDQLTDQKPPCCCADGEGELCTSQASAASSLSVSPPEPKNESALPEEGDRSSGEAELKE